MAKTKRHKINKSPKVGFANAKLAVCSQGFRIACNGHRTAEGTKMQPNKDATPVFVGRRYTGVPRGKVYPYAGKKRGGTTD
jgi:hypothetical protein